MLIYPESVRVLGAIFQDLESFGKREVFQNGYGKVLDFCLGQFYDILKWITLSVVLNALYDIFVHSTICNARHNLPKKIIKCSIENNIFLFLWGFKILTKIFFMILGMFWKSFAIVIKGFCTNPV